jgi:DNA-binding XRE family transcriptional regulator
MTTHPTDDVPADERMTAAELRVVREYLGLTGDALAAHLGVSSRTLRHWEAGVYAIPDGVREEIEDLEEVTARAVDDAVAQLMDVPDPVAVVYRTDDEYHHAHPEITLPASWQRAVVARAAERVPGLGIDYAPPPASADRRAERIAEARVRAAELGTPEARAYGGRVPPRVTVEVMHCGDCQEVHRIAVAHVEGGGPTPGQVCVCTRSLQLVHADVVPLT